MTLSRKLVAGLTPLREGPLPREVLDAARLHLLDALGIGIAASRLKPGRIYSRYGKSVAHGGPATILGFAIGASAADAAMVNGGLIHSLEYDDTHTASLAHGSATLASAALAAAERAGASGAVLLRAYVVGWEALVRLALASPGGYQTRGFHVTSVCGALAASVAAAAVADLDEEAGVAAVGIALSQASGVLEFVSNGSSVKSLHPGWVAHAGVIAADLARAGMTGPETALEGRFGLFRVFAQDESAAGRFAKSVATLGDVWHLPDAAYKFWSSCHYTHAFVEAAGLLAGRGLTADRIARLTCHVPPAMAALICEPWAAKLAPLTGHAARWSLPVVVAARILRGTVDLELFEDVIAPDILELASRSTWIPMVRTDFPNRFEAEIRVEMIDGSVMAERVDDVYGNSSNPARRGDILAKFEANAARAFPVDKIEALRDAVLSLDESRDLSLLQRALRNVGDGAPWNSSR